MAIKEVFMLGNPLLYEISQPVLKNELDQLAETIQDLHDTLMFFKKKYGAGRAIASPQIGVMKRLLYMNIDKPVVFINPELHRKSKEMIEVWDDCMSFPDLYVKVRRHNKIKIDYKDPDWKDNTLEFSGDLALLLQHEYNHLDGVLAVTKSIDCKSFALRSQKHFLDL